MKSSNIVYSDTISKYWIIAHYIFIDDQEVFR